MKGVKRFPKDSQIPGEDLSVAARVSCVLVVAVPYPLGFFPLHRFVGDVAGAFVQLPVALAGLLLGLRGGVYAATLTALYDKWKNPSFDQIDGSQSRTTASSCHAAGLLPG